MSWERSDRLAKWIPLNGFVDPPEPPDGYKLETKRQDFMGIVTHYRWVRI